MIKSKDMKVLSLSVLCCAVLTACGGGGKDSIFIDDTVGGDTGAGGTGGTTTVITPGGLPINDDYVPTSNKFLKESTTGIGQQTDLIVASVKYGNRHYGAVKFDQPGFVSEVCPYGTGTCIDKSLQKALENAQKDVQKYTAERDKAQERLNTVLGTDKPDQALITQLKDEVQDLNNQVNIAERNVEYIEENTPAANEVVIRDINGSIVKQRAAAAIDYDNLPSINDPMYDEYLVQRDAGIKTKDFVRKADGSKVADGGTIDRAFNGVILFQDSLGRHYVDGYARDPAAPGWAYQTFAVFSNKDYSANRDLNIGYHSFGEKTKNSDLPKEATATYHGISHAYYNKNQVTSHNEIEVDFGDRTVKYRTKGTPLLHTYENGEHIVQEKADYAVTADATFAKDNNEFEGTATTAGGLKGTLQGQFYGSNVQEIGGVYGLKDDNNTVHYIGGFGGKRK